MARRKLKLTPFARFFIFLLFAAPIAYLVASYYNGQDGVKNIKEVLGWDKSAEQEAAPTAAPATDRANTAELDCEQLRSDYERLQKQYQELREDNLRLMGRLEELKESATGEGPATDSSRSLEQ